MGDDSGSLYNIMDGLSGSEWLISHAGLCCRRVQGCNGDPACQGLGHVSWPPSSLPPDPAGARLQNFPYVCANSN